MRKQSVNRVNPFVKEFRDRMEVGLSIIFVGGRRRPRERTFGNLVEAEHIVGLIGVDCLIRGAEDIEID